MSVRSVSALSVAMDRVGFRINGVQYSVGCEVSSETTLLDYLRSTLQLRGTKYMCLEGGCGACIVSVTKFPGATVEGVNSCLVSVTSCEGWDITTIEGLGNRLKGYHPLQKTLAQYNGTQCGYCSPGWVMAMNSILQKNKGITMREIERSLASNVCRCTGYRPILEAFKTFAKDAPTPSLRDIEDLSICKKTGRPCRKNSSDESDWCIIDKEDTRSHDQVLQIKLKDGRLWFKAQYLRHVYDILNKHGNFSYMLVAGNTGKGVYPMSQYPQILIDISMVQELKGYFIAQNLVVGAGNTLTDVMEIFEVVSNSEYFDYLRVLNDHLQLVAHIPVKNLGTLAGNLMLKNRYPEFKSDIFLLFETIGADITIVNCNGITKILNMQRFLKENMQGKIILNVLLPPFARDVKVVSYKVMPRAQSAQAIIHAGFLYRLTGNSKVLESRIVIGGLSTNFIRAIKTEKYLQGKQLFTNETLQGAVHILNDEMVVTADPIFRSEYRRRAALGLFYKGLLSLCPPSILGSRYRSGAIKLFEARPVSDARQIFETNPTLWPLNKPIPKVEALIQCAGEASYSEDVPSLPGEVFAAFALTTVALGTIVSIDASKALREPGVIAFYKAKDIPGENTFTPAGTTFFLTNEEVLCSGEVKYYNQPLGIIVAETQHIAERAARMVTAAYTNIRKPVIDVKAAKNNTSRTTLYNSIPATETGTDVAAVIKGENAIYGQYHFCIETLVCVSHPTEEGIKLYPATQWIDGVQWMTSRVLGIEQNRIDVHVRRLGGAYGIKISRPNWIAVACSVVTYKLNRPCRFIQSLRTNMRAIGKRLPCDLNFEVAVNSQGVIQYNNYDIYEDNGYVVNEPLIMLGLDVYYNCYTRSRWTYRGFNVLTDNPSNTWCRSPGTLEAIAMAEYIMERISYELSLDPIQVRLNNLDRKQFADMTEVVDTIKKNSDYEKRRSEVTSFNLANRWKKRGLRVSFLRWTPTGPVYYTTNLSVFHGDGTVAIVHGGIEMGQGINTKAVQICAYLLKIPIEKIQIKANNATTAPNCFISGGSLASQSVGIGVQRCCEELLVRLQPIRAQMENATWEELIQAAYVANVDLQTHAYITPNDVPTYHIYGATVAEVEIDVLTGEWELRRVDLLEDVGQSVSPEIDIGQVEGAFIMSSGYWTSEELVYDKNTGELRTDRTWTYWVPQSTDIPQDFRVYFRKRSYSLPLILGSKTTGEPATCMGVVVPFAMREAITAARLESGIPATQWFDIDGSYTRAKICLATATKIEDFKYF